MVSNLERILAAPPYADFSSSEKAEMMQSRYRLASLAGYCRSASTVYITPSWCLKNIPKVVDSICRIPVLLSL
jgi:hypothetical protein